MSQQQDKKYQENPIPVQPLEKEFDNLLNGFEDDNQLNLTGGEKNVMEEGEEDLKKVQQEYEKFMKEMQAGGEDEAPENDENVDIQGMGAALGNLLKGLVGDNGQNFGDDLGNHFSDMFKNFDNGGDIGDVAQKLLSDFMDKSLLEEPLKETDENYKQYFAKQEQEGKQIEQRFKKQHEIVVQILQLLQKQPTNKSKMIALFEQMQKHGNPPESIAPMSGMSGLF